MFTENPNKCLSPNPKFVYDEACLDVINGDKQTVQIFGQYAECDRCDFESLANVRGNTNTSLLINTKYAVNMYYVRNNSRECNLTEKLSEHYRFGWNVSNTCSPIYIKEPADNTYLPILSAFIILFFFGTMWYMVKCIYKCSKKNETWRRYILWPTEFENDLGSPLDGAPIVVIERPPALRKHPNRVKSIDVFRGLCIIMMIFVNYGGGQYWIFKHSVWNGITIADLVFPWFIWIMGLSLSISFNNRLRRAVPRRQLIMQVIRRSFILILAGIIINSHGMTAPLATLRYPGVLQRIGVTYFIVGIIEACLAKRTQSIGEYGFLNPVQDIVVAWPQWLMVTILVAIHTGITFLLDVPGCGKGYLGPGGLQDHGLHQNCTGGAAGYIDRVVLGKHVYTHPTCRKLYETTIDYDPEGILGTLTSVLLAYLGVQAGRILHTYTNVNDKVKRWVVWGLVTGVTGELLCGYSKNDGIIPLNKNLWSLSFVLVLAGLAFVLEAFLFVVVDITRKWGGRPFFYPGMNPFLLYVGHELFKNTFPFAWTPEHKTHGAYLFMNLWGTAVWVAISIWLYKRNMFLSI